MNGNETAALDVTIEAAKEGTTSNPEYTRAATPCNVGESFYVARVDASNQPIQRLSGVTASRANAEERLRWIRRREPRVRLVRELVFRTLEG